MIKYFGKGLSNVVNIIDPDIIVLGGGLSNTNELYDDFGFDGCSDIYEDGSEINT